MFKGFKVFDYGFVFIDLIVLCCCLDYCVFVRDLISEGWYVKVVFYMVVDV